MRKNDLCKLWDGTSIARGFSATGKFLVAMSHNESSLTFTIDSRDDVTGWLMTFAGVTVAGQSGWSCDSSTCCLHCCCCCCSCQCRSGVAVTWLSTPIGSGNMNGVSLSLHTCISARTWHIHHRNQSNILTLRQYHIILTSYPQLILPSVSAAA